MGWRKRPGSATTSGVRAGDTERGSPALVVYADDMVALCHTRQQARQVKARMAGWLAPRGLSFNEAKTRIVTSRRASTSSGSTCAVIQAAS